MFGFQYYASNQNRKHFKFAMMAGERTNETFIQNSKILSACSAHPTGFPRQHIFSEWSLPLAEAVLAA